MQKLKDLIVGLSKVQVKNALKQADHVRHFGCGRYVREEHQNDMVGHIRRIKKRRRSNRYPSLEIRPLKGEVSTPVANKSVIMLDGVGISMLAKYIMLIGALGM